MKDEKETKEVEEPEVITFKEIVERNKNIKKEELFKLVLVCKNCSHKDLLKNFIRKKEKMMNWDGLKDEIKPTPWKPKPTPWKPDPYWKGDPYKRYRCSKTTKQNLSCLMLDKEEYEDMFFCPKCKSSLVVLDPDFVKNNILKGMGNG